MNLIRILDIRPLLKNKSRPDTAISDLMPFKYIILGVKLPIQITLLSCSAGVGISEARLEDAEPRGVIMLLFGFRKMRS